MIRILAREEYRRRLFARLVSLNDQIATDRRHGDQRRANSLSNSGRRPSRPTGNSTGERGLGRAGIAAFPGNGVRLRGWRTVMVEDIGSAAIVSAFAPDLALYRFMWIGRRTW